MDEHPDGPAGIGHIPAVDRGVEQGMVGTREPAEGVAEHLREEYRRCGPQLPGTCRQQVPGDSEDAVGRACGTVRVGDHLRVIGNIRELRCEVAEGLIGAGARIHLGIGEISRLRRYVLPVHKKCQGAFHRQT